MTKFKPFADDTSTVAIAEINVENGLHRISLYGTLEITRDQRGLKHARELEKLIADIVATLEEVVDLPAIAPDASITDVTTVNNPFN